MCPNISSRITAWDVHYSRTLLRCITESCPASASKLRPRRVSSGVLLSSSNRITYLESALEMSQLRPVATTIMLGMTPEPSQSSLTVSKAALECGTVLPSLSAGASGGSVFVGQRGPCTACPPTRQVPYGPVGCS